MNLSTMVLCAAIESNKELIHDQIILAELMEFAPVDALFVGEKAILSVVSDAARRAASESSSHLRLNFAVQAATSHEVESWQHLCAIAMMAEMPRIA